MVSSVEFLYKLGSLHLRRNGHSSTYSPLSLLYLPRLLRTFLTKSSLFRASGIQSISRCHRERSRILGYATNNWDRVVVGAVSEVWVLHEVREGERNRVDGQARWLLPSLLLPVTLVWYSRKYFILDCTTYGSGSVQRLLSQLNS